MGRLRVVWKVLLVCAGYYAGAIIGISFGFPPSGISTIWPPNAILLAALLLEAPRLWWIYLLAALPTHLLVVADFQDPVPLAVMLSQYAGNAVHVILGAAAVRAAAGGPPRFDSLRGMTEFILLAAIASTIVACAAAVGLFQAIGWTTDFWLAWRQRFFSNGFAVLTITPPILLAIRGELVGARHPRGRRYAELALVAIGLSTIGILVIALDPPRAEIMPALMLAPLPFLLWAAVRLGPGGLCIALLVVTFISWSTVYAGRWPFATQSWSGSVLSLHAFLLAMSIPMMFLAAIVEERRRTEQETRRQRDELAHAQRVTTLGELAASIAHELRQPLTAITANAQAGCRFLDAGSGTTASTHEILTDISNDARRAEHVIARLRALFLKERSERAHLDLNTLIDDAIGLVRSDLEQKRIVIRFARDDTLPPVVGDPVQLQQVLLNLIMNAGEAVAATIDGPREITIDVGQPRRGHILLTIRDTGIGLRHPELLEKMFEHFVSSKPHGLGLGLTITRSLVEAHGGTIWAAVNRGRGLTVQFELPAAETRHAPALLHGSPQHRRS
jgi:signal transduction histidine kinase